MNKNSTPTHFFFKKNLSLVHLSTAIRKEFWNHQWNSNLLKSWPSTAVFLSVLLAMVFTTPVLAQQTQPVLDWSTYFGGSTRNDVIKYSVDDDGSIWFSNLVQNPGTGMPTSPGAWQGNYVYSGANGNNFNSYIGKITPDGQFEYGSYFATNRGDLPAAIAQDDDYVYALNNIWSKPVNLGVTFPQTGNNYGAVNAHERHGYLNLVKIDKSTNTQVLVTSLPGTEYILSNTQGSAYWGQGANSTTTNIITQDGYAYFAGACARYPRNAHQESWAYIIKPDHTGTLIRLNRVNVAEHAIRLARIDVAQNGDLLMVGGARGSGTNFSTTDGTTLTNPLGNWDMFLRRYDRNGILIFSTLLGGTEHENVFDEANVNVTKVMELPNGNIVVSGVTMSTDFPYTDGTVDGNGTGDIFLAAYAADGTKLWVKSFISDGLNLSNFAMKPHPDGQQIIVYTYGDETNNFVITPDAAQPNYGGGVTDQYIAFLDPNTGNVNYGTYYGGSGEEYPVLGAAEGEDIHIYGNDILFSGVSTSTDYPATPGATNKHSGSFLVLDGNGQLQMATTTNIQTGKVYMDDDVIYAYGSYYNGETHHTTLNAFQAESNASGTNQQGVFLKIRRCDGKVVYQTFMGGLSEASPNGTPSYSFRNTAYLSERQPEFVNGKLIGAEEVYTPSVRHPTTEGAMQTSPGGDVDVTFFAFDMEKEVTWEENVLIPATQSTCTNGIVGPIDGSRVTIDPDDLPKINRGSLQSYPEQKATYQWQIASTASGPWMDINGAVQEDYQHNDIGGDDIYLRRLAFNPNSSYCDDTLSISNVHSILVSSDIAPSAVAGDPARICPGETWPLGGAPTATGGVGPYTYRWEPGTGLTDLTDTIAENPTAQPSVSTIYTVEVTDNNGCIALDQVTVNVWSYTAGEDQAMC
uniref:hypothetical protein n=1 Tax=Membranihabitans marinus TaxID=1227546 RepID=UPI001F292E80